MIVYNYHSIRATQIICVSVDDNRPITMAVYIITAVSEQQILCVSVDNSHRITMIVYNSPCQIH